MKLFLCLTTLIIFNIFAGGDVTQCRKSIDSAVKMTSGAQLLNSQCTDAVVKDLLGKKEYEVNELMAYDKELVEELKKYAVSTNEIITNCGVESLNKMENVVKCRAIKAERDVLLNRIDRLNKWEVEFKKALSNPITAFEKVGDPPCASTVEFEKLIGIKKFNKDIYKSWEECMAKL